MGKVIVADENQGRRTLLASTLEREGFDVTRAGTLRQAEGTALAVMPEVVLLELAENVVCNKLGHRTTVVQAINH